ncbi:MAG: PIN domain-containing protein [Chloroflexi bacterium]|nr:PIN domain-containing protein [Chloroflexota bacterium]
MTICVDANLVIRLVVKPQDMAIHQIWETWTRERHALVAPRLLLYEVTNVIYLSYKRQTLSATAARSALDTILALPIRIEDTPQIHILALEMAGRFKLSAAYDAHYLAVAQYLGAEFWTSDQRLFQAVQPILTWVKLAPE